MSCLKHQWSSGGKFVIDGQSQATISFRPGVVHRFDLSDSSLYNATTTLNHQLKFSTTSDGTHNEGTAYTTGVTTSAATIDIGTAGAYIQIVVASGAPTLYYYCANHSGMGNQANTSQYVTTVDNEGSAVIFNSTDHGPNIANISLESGVVGRKDTDVILLEDGKNKRNTKVFLKFLSSDLIRKKIKEFGCRVN